MVLKSVSYQTTAAGTSGAAAAAVSGDSLIVENAPVDSKVRIVSWWAQNQTSGWHQLIFPSGHDTTRGIRVVTPAAIPMPVWPQELPIQIYPQETLALTLAGSATAGDIEYGTFNILYDQLPGIETRLIDEDTLRSRMNRLTTVQATLAAGTGGGWTGSELITAESDLLRANTDYAVLGLTNSAAAAAIGLKAPDFGNVRIAIPGSAAFPQLTCPYFIQLTRDVGVGLIPVFNSANRGNVYLDALQDENGTDPIVSLLLAELKG